MSTTCSICLNDQQILPIKLDCGHIFCYICIKGYKLSDFHSAKCPLCRAPIDKKILEHLSLQDCLDTSEHQDIEYQWFYHGRTAGWWKYDEETNQEIENLYQSHLVNIEQQHLPQGTQQSINDGGSRDSEDDSEEERTDIIKIGIVKYNLNFDRMTQTNQVGFERKILRLKNYQIDEKLPSEIKGIAGLSSQKK